ncbi:general secretion pathway protein B [Shewanella halifaxensis HAW-EB4]|uniref:General secretion pathway protein B n=1 Tax=Shewanella halifaxensis (strain HAW-EB4) TaxID=458817 RepID=B0TIP8_SHEHH|nr:general secretion pathway protein GspB [Shewanella halifaxensis]ABZ75593.1 general secretion pathway protein B [Shewanella halifaxensis HAW-EB4]
MSILLDAVTRDKQQSQSITHDVVLTPRAQYKAKQGRGKGLKHAAIFVSLLLLMILSAWLLSQALYPESAVNNGLGETASVNSKSHSTSNIQELGKLELAKQESTQPVGHQEVDSASTPESVPEIRLAGKVALPIAQPLAVTQLKGVTASVLPTNNVAAEEPSGDLMAALLKAQQSVEQASESVSNQSINQGTDQAPDQSEPIILGANSNQRGDELLESLKYQVEYAANDVGLERAESAANNNNLLAVFEAALKDVERENSVATPVTEEKLDPIPTTPKSDAIPKYGQLPAGLQLQVPEFNINAHVYSSVPENRWLNVDGAELQEGDSIQGKLTIVEIRPRDVVLAVQGTEFKVPAI